MKKVVVYAGAAKKTKAGRSGVVLHAVGVVGEGSMEQFEELAFDLLLGKYPRQDGYYSHTLASDPFILTDELTDEVLGEIGYIPAESEESESAAV